MIEPKKTEDSKDSADLWPLFICYRQSDGRRVAERLFSLLKDAFVSAATLDDLKNAARLDIYFDQVAPGVSDWTAIHEPYLKRARAFILICTPGAKLNEGEGDWVHREIAWWISNREAAPILIDALGEKERYVPQSVAEKWPNAQRIEVVLDEWDRINGKELDSLAERTRQRILGGITQSAGVFYREELERERVRSSELSTALAARQRLSSSLKALSLVLAILSTLAIAATAIALRSRSFAESRSLAAQAEAEVPRDRSKSVAFALQAINRAKTTESALALADAFPSPISDLSDNSRVVDTTFAPKTGIVATVSDDEKVRLWTLSGRLIAWVSGQFAQFAPNGRILATVASNNLVQIWDVTKDNPVATLTSPFNLVGDAVRFSPDGRYMLTSGKNTVALWDCQTWRILKTLHIAQSDPKMSISSDGQRILTYETSSSYVQEWDAANGRLRATIGLPGGDAKRPKGSTDRVATSIVDGKLLMTFVESFHSGVLSAEFSSNGQLVLIATSDSDAESMLQDQGRNTFRRVALREDDLAHSENHDTARVWNADNGKLLTEVHVTQISSAALSPNGDQIITASLDGSIQMWKALDGRLNKTIRGHSAEIRDVKFAAHGALIASSGDDHNTRLWSASTGELIANIPGSGGMRSQATVFPNGHFAVTIRPEVHGATVWSLSTGELVASLSPHEGDFENVAYSPDGHLIAASTDNGSACLWDAMTGKLLVTFSGPGEFAGIQFSRDSRWVVTAGSDKALRIWEAATGRLLASRSAPEDLSALRISDDGKFIVASGKTSSTVWKIDTESPIVNVAGETSEVAAIAPDGCCLITGGHGGTAKMWRLPERQMIGVVTANSDKHFGLFGASFSPDGKSFLTIGNDSTAKIWSVKDLKMIMPIKGHNGSITQAAFSPDGTRILTSSIDGTTKLWDISTGHQLADVTSRRLDLKYASDSIAFSGDGTKILTVQTTSSDVFLWGGKSGDLITRISGSQPVLEAVFSPNGSQIVTTRSGEPARLYRLVTLADVLRALGEPPIADD